MSTRTLRFLLALTVTAIIAALLAAGWLLFGTRSHDFLVDEADYYVADPIAGHLHRPHFTREFNWAEHPRGRITFHTNNLGLREDRDTSVDKKPNTVRVLVTGDSHTDGVVNNAESFPHLLEAKLNSTFGEGKFEVLNGGVGYYGFQNYAGFLRREIALKPDCFVVTIYLGNDFLDGIRFATRRGELRDRTRSILYRYRLWRAPGALVNQAGNQIVYFETFPDMKTPALEIAQREIDSIQRICRDQHIALLFILLPTIIDVNDDARAQAAKALHLNDEELSLNQSLKNSLISALRTDGLDYIDLTGEMLARPQTLFWLTDYHLSDKGHQLVAESLFKYFTQRNGAFLRSAKIEK